MANVGVTWSRTFRYNVLRLGERAGWPGCGFPCSEEHSAHQPSGVSSPFLKVMRSCCSSPATELLAPKELLPWQASINARRVFLVLSASSSVTSISGGGRYSTIGLGESCHQIRRAN